MRLGIALVLILLLAATGLAEDTIKLEPVVVTAEKRARSVEDTARSVTVVSGDTLDDAGINNLRAASLLVPNVNLIEFSPRRLSFPYIRGIGSGQVHPAVAVYIDGVPELSINTANLVLTDIERIEFVRGPQATLYGRNTLGGLIHIVTRDPSDSWQSRLGYSAGSDDFHDVSLSLSGPLTDAIGSHLSGGFVRRAGHTKNEITGNELDDQEAMHGRWVLQSSSDDWDIRLSLRAERARDGGFVLSELRGLRDNPHRVRYDFEGRSERDIVSPALRLTHHGDRTRFTSISAYEFWRIEEWADTDFSEFDLFRRFTQERQNQITQELQLASSDDGGIELGEHVDLDWLLGVLYFHSDFKHDSYTENRPTAFFFGQAAFIGTDHTEADLEDHGVGIFGHSTIHIGERTELGLGLRYEWEDKRADRANFTNPAGAGATSAASFHDRFDTFQPSYSLAYRFSDRVNSYISAAKGFKAGGFNTKAPTNADVPFDAETSWTYELGVKSNWFDEKLRLQATLFYIDWDDMQIFLPDPANPSQFFIDNAGDSKSRGVEVELAAILPGEVELSVGFGYTDAEFTEHTDPFTNADASGNQLLYAPEFTWNVALQKRFELTQESSLLLRTDVTAVGEYFYDAANSEGQGAYYLADIRAGIRCGNVETTIWVENVFDEEYIPVAFQASPTLFFGTSGAPRTFGISVGIDF